MKKVLKIVFCCCLFLYSASISAQINDYLDSENKRISQAQQTEIEIQKFIDANFNKYKLSQSASDEVLQHLTDDGEFTPEQVEKAKVNAKYIELRKLFFLRNPERKGDYIANTIPSSIRQQCVNGDFESGTAGYSFWTDSHPSNNNNNNNYPFFLSCATPTALTASNGMTPAVNNFNARVTYIDDTSAGYLAFDPALAALGVNIPTLSANGGNKCIKLNNEEGLGSSDLTTMSHNFSSINEETIDFNFSIVMNNKIAHGQPIQPYFRARLYDEFNNIVDEFCIVADPDNCLFTVLPVDNTRRMLYTGWICGRLNSASILNKPGRVEFSVSDCAPSAHFGTVYIDNICGMTCSTLDLGAVNLLPTNINCPDIIGNTPFEVCGTYQAPANSTLSTITLDITQGGVVIGTINTPSQLSSSSFCFTVFPNMFGSDPMGDFEFQINATFGVNCAAGTFDYEISDNSANAGPDVTFVDCCEPTLTLTSPTDDHNNLAPMNICQRERSNWIKASNLISFGNNALANGVVYHAENYVELNPGFEAVEGSQFAAYPEGCSGGYIYRDSINNIPSTTYQMPIEDEMVNLTKLLNGFAIIPNPSNSLIDVVMDGGLLNNVSITTIDGKTVFEKNYEATENAKIDVTRYPNGIYIINVTTNDGQQLTEKLIKN